MRVLRRIDQAEEQRIREMRDEQRRLHVVPTPVAHIGLTVYDKNGVPTAHYEDRSKSWTRNFYNWMASQQFTADLNAMGTTFEAGRITVRDTGGIVRQFGFPIYHSNSTSGTTFGNGYRAAGGSVINGIVIGTSDSAESFESFALGTLIEEGTRSGQMQYLAMNAIVPVWDGTAKTITYTCQRNMVNASGVSIGVKEVGLISSMTGTAGGQRFLVARDVLFETVDVPNESMIKVTYTIQIAYPE